MRKFLSLAGHRIEMTGFRGFKSGEIQTDSVIALVMVFIVVVTNINCE